MRDSGELEVGGSELKKLMGRYECNKRKCYHLKLNITNRCKEILDLQ